MKNKKMIFGTIILLFAISGICNIPNVSATEVEIPPLSYVYTYVATLEPKDVIWLHIDSNGDINVYIMNADQFDELQNSLGTIWNYCKRWRDIVSLHESFTITEDGSYYIVLYNKNLLFGRTVNVDINYYYYETAEPSNPFIGLQIFIIFIAIIAGIIIVLQLQIKRLKRKREHKKLKETIKNIKIQEEKIPEIIYCPECGADILDKSRKFCSVCGTEIIK